MLTQQRLLGIDCKLTVTLDTLALQPEQPAVVGGGGMSPSSVSMASIKERMRPSLPGGAATCIGININLPSGCSFKPEESKSASVCLEMHIADLEKL